jgi:hypothetical protein
MPRAVSGSEPGTELRSRLPSRIRQSSRSRTNRVQTGVHPAARTLTEQRAQVAVGVDGRVDAEAASLLGVFVAYRTTDDDPRGPGVLARRRGRPESRHSRSPAGPGWSGREDPGMRRWRRTPRFAGRARVCRWSYLSLLSGLHEGWDVGVHRVRRLRRRRARLGVGYDLIVIPGARRAQGYLFSSDGR